MSKISRLTCVQANACFMLCIKHELQCFILVWKHEKEMNVEAKPRRLSFSNVFRP